MILDSEQRTFVWLEIKYLLVVLVLAERADVVEVVLVQLELRCDLLLGGLDSVNFSMRSAKL